MDELLSLAKIFSDLNRLKILALILRDKEVCVCEVCDTLELSQPLVSRHLKQMKEANILQAHKNGKWVIYSLHEKPSSALDSWAHELKKHLDTLPAIVSCQTK